MSNIGNIGGDNFDIGEKCYLCGLRAAYTKDHLFPSGLFNKPLPTNLPKRLPACSE